MKKQRKRKGPHERAKLNSLSKDLKQIDEEIPNVIDDFYITNTLIGAIVGAAGERGYALNENLKKYLEGEEFEQDQDFDMAQFKILLDRNFHAKAILWRYCEINGIHGDFINFLDQKQIKWSVANFMYEIWVEDEDQYDRDEFGESLQDEFLRSHLCAPLFIWKNNLPKIMKDKTEQADNQN